MLKNLPQLLDKLEYDTAPKMSAGQINDITEPTVCIVFDRADINAAAHYVARSMESPFAANAVLTLLVQESVGDEFLAKLQGKLPEYAPGDAVLSHVGFKNAVETAARLKAKTTTVADVPVGTAATVVHDLTHEQLGPLAGSGALLTLHIFRTAKEAIALAGKESIVFTNAMIWHENHACAYELAVAMNCHNYYINCWGVSLAPLSKHAADGSTYVAIEKSHHFETLFHGGQQRSVVFPIGSIFAN